MNRSHTYILTVEPMAMCKAKETSKRIWDAQKQLQLNCVMALQHQHEGKPFYGPLLVDIQFGFPIQLQTDKSTNHHYQRPTLDHLIKFILDIGHSTIFNHDCTIAQLYAKKIYTSQIGTTIFVKELE